MRNNTAHSLRWHVCLLAITKPTSAVFSINTVNRIFKRTAPHQRYEFVHFLYNGIDPSSERPGRQSLNTEWERVRSGSLSSFCAAAHTKFMPVRRQVVPRVRAHTHPYKMYATNKHIIRSHAKPNAPESRRRRSQMPMHTVKLLGSVGSSPERLSCSTSLRAMCACVCLCVNVGFVWNCP